MTREQVNRMLRHMEQLRMDADEAETKKQERELLAEYGRLSQAIRPYIEGKLPYSEQR